MGFDDSNRYSDSETESRSPSPSSGVETNSFKDSPMQIDVMGLDQGWDMVNSSEFVEKLAPFFIHLFAFCFN